MRALNEVLGVELQPEELLLEAVEAPCSWREERDEMSSGEEMEGQAVRQPGGPAPKRLRGEGCWVVGASNSRRCVVRFSPFSLED